MQHHFPLITLHYAAVFVVGAVLAQKRVELVRVWRRLGRLGQSVVAVASLLLLSYGPGAAGPLLAREPRTESFAEVATGWLVRLPLAVVLVSALAETWFTRMLERRHVQWLGRVSYSFYLLHVPCLYVVIEALWGRVPAGVVLAVALGLTLVLAAVFFWWVELPSMALGASLAGRLARRSAERAGRAAAR